MVAGIDVGGKNRLMFSAKKYGGFFSHTTDNLVVCIENIPLAFDLLGLGTKSFHREPSIKPCAPEVSKILSVIFEWTHDQISKLYQITKRENGQEVLGIRSHECRRRTYNRVVSFDLAAPSSRESWSFCA